MRGNLRKIRGRMAREPDFLLPVGKPLLRQKYRSKRRFVLEPNNDDAPIPAKEESWSQQFARPLVHHPRSEPPEKPNGKIAERHASLSHFLGLKVAGQPLSFHAPPIAIRRALLIASEEIRGSRESFWNSCA
jgi:hypothetical protein